MFPETTKGGVYVDAGASNRHGAAQGAAAWRRLERKLDVRMIETVSIVYYHDYKQQGLEGFEKLDQGARILVVDDLVDIGATAKVVREMLPKAQFATIYAKPLGRPLVDTFITEVSKDTWIDFPWDMGLAFEPAIVLASSAAVAGPATSEDLVAAKAKAAGHADDGHGGVYFPDRV